MASSRSQPRNTTPPIDAGRSLLSFLPADNLSLAGNLIVESFVGHEALNELFSFDVELLCNDPDLRAEALLGTRGSVGLKLQNQKAFRYFDGFINRVTRLSPRDRMERFQVQLVPWLWFLTLSRDCRVFQNLTVLEILAKLFEDFDFRDFLDATRRSHAPLDYCVQYNESTFNFVLRLCEEEGLLFFFTHERAKHTLIIVDDNSVYRPCLESRVPFRHFKLAGHNSAPGAVFDWSSAEELCTSSYASKDFNFKQPKQNLLVSVRDGSQANNSASEIFQYPGLFVTRDDGEVRCEARLDVEQSPIKTIHGSSSCREFASGSVFEVFGLARAEECGKYLLTSVMHEAHEEATQGQTGNRTEYVNRFACVPRNVNFRPAIAAVRPTVPGPQTAIVVGPRGEEIYTDEHGRIKVQFHWDREGQSDDRSSCWIRVTHPVAGTRWGFFGLPRIGQEVVVAFLDGNPDRPLITGSVNNGQNMPPFPLPGDQTKLGVRSRSSKGGSNENFSEIRIDDKSGAEELRIHAERFKGESVEQDSAELVGRDRTLSIARNQVEHVKGSKHSSVDRELRQKIGGALSLTVNQSRDEKVGTKWAVYAGDEIHLSSGAKLVIDAAGEITIRASGGFITIGPDGVTIQGTLVRINSGGKAATGSGANPLDPHIPIDWS